MREKYTALADSCSSTSHARHKVLAGIVMTRGECWRYDGQKVRPNSTMKKRSEVQSNVITYHSLHADLLSVQNVFVKQFVGLWYLVQWTAASCNLCSVLSSSGIFEKKRGMHPQGILCRLCFSLSEGVIHHLHSYFTHSHLSHKKALWALLFSLICASSSPPAWN